MSDPTVTPGSVPGWEGAVGPFPGQYGWPHVYARDVQSGAGNCVCGAHLRHRKHVQAAPGVPIPEAMQDPPDGRIGVVHTIRGPETGYQDHDLSNAGICRCNPWIWQVPDGTVYVEHQPISPQPCGMRCRCPKGHPCPLPKGHDGPHDLGHGHG